MRRRCWILAVVAILGLGCGGTQSADSQMGSTQVPFHLLTGSADEYVGHSIRTEAVFAGTIELDDETCDSGQVQLILAAHDNETAQIREVCAPEEVFQSVSEASEGDSVIVTAVVEQIGADEGLEEGEIPGFRLRVELIEFVP